MCMYACVHAYRLYTDIYMHVFKLCIYSSMCGYVCGVVCCVCVYCVVSMCVCHRAYTDVRGQVFSFLLYYVGPRDGAEVVSLSCRYLYPLSMNS